MPTLSRKRKATRDSATWRAPSGPAWSGDLSHAWKPPAREPGYPLAGRWETASLSGPHREGRTRNPMMNGQGKSDSPIVPVKSPNKAARNAVRGSTRQTQSWESWTAYVRLQDGTNEFGSRHCCTTVTFDLLFWSFYQLKRRAAAGVDGVTWDQYETGLESNLAGLHEAYRGADDEFAAARRSHNGLRANADATDRAHTR